MTSLLALEPFDNPDEKIDNPPVVLQGGEAFETAYIIPSLPFTDSGTTVGYQNNYSYPCPYTYVDGPDVCYAYSPISAVETVTVLLCDPYFDTKLKVYANDENNIFGCNDDACGPDGYRSALYDMAFEAGNTYYIVISGYMSQVGDYVLEVIGNPPPPCEAIAGDSNGDGIFNGLDVVYSVNYLKGWDVPPPVICNCLTPLFAGADANGNCSYNGLDVTYSIQCLKVNFPAQLCPNCP